MVDNYLLDNLNFNINYFYPALLIMIWLFFELVAASLENNRIIILVLCGFAILFVSEFLCNNITVNYVENVSKITTEEKLNTSVLPSSDYFSDEGYMYLSYEGRIIKALPSEDIQYVKVSSEQPFVIVDKIVFNPKETFYFTSESIAKIKKEPLVIVKEVHY